nr:unnamed protein product [Digitaria exilis]
MAHLLTISPASLLSAAADDPPSTTAFRHATFIAAAFSLTFLPSSPPPIISLTARSSSAASTKFPFFLSTSMLTATPMAPTIANALRCCSAYIGHGAMGTPHHKLSITEFHPQCVTNPPTAACAKISFCGAVVGHTIPLPPPPSSLSSPVTASRNPSGRSSPPARSASVGLLVPGAGGPRSTQRNRWPLRSRPWATSCACAAVRNPALPKQRNTTDAATARMDAPAMSAGERDHRADGVETRRSVAMRAPAGGNGGEDAGLELGGGVDDDAIGVGEPAAMVRVPRALRLRLLHHRRQEGERRDGGKPGDVHRRAAVHVHELAGDLVAERR